MLRIYKLFSPLILLLFFTACGGHPITQSDQENCPLQNNSMGPQWACEPYLAGGVAAVGVEPIDPHNKEAQTKRATDNAHDALKRQIHFKINRILKNFAQLTGIGSYNQMKSISNEVSAKVIASILTQSVEAKLWDDPSNSDRYVLMAVNPTISHDVTKKEILEALQANKKLWKEIDDKDGLDVLLPEILKEMGQIPNL